MTTMHSNDPICEQLSAWMDGELSPEEAKFFERRLQHDENLQAMFARMQMMSSCFKGQQIRPMSASLCANIKAALEHEKIEPALNAHSTSAVAMKKRSPVFAWAAAASVAAIAVIFAPRLWQSTSQPAAEPTSVIASAVEPNPLPSFASADMVAALPRQGSDVSVPANVPMAASEDGLQTEAAVVSSQSPMPLADVESPENFPLNVSAQKKTWPRSSLAVGTDPAMEAYLVRHNQMMADGGLGGFVPYVDVMAEDIENSEQKPLSDNEAKANNQ